ncbi:MAG: ATP synthase subunit I [Bryobacteraceae bacterium]
MDAAFLEAAIGRMLRVTTALTIAGAAFVAAGWGWRVALGFLVGAALSYGNFRLWIRMARGLGAPGASPRGAVFLGLRYLLVGAAVYVIISVSGVSLPALSAGLLVAVGAVIAEIVYELIFLRS